jgi:hypothetical protein
MSQGLGRYQLSLDEAKFTLSSDADFTPAYVNQAFSQLYLDRPQDAENTVQEALARKLQTPELLLLQYFVANQRADRVMMDQAIASGQSKLGAEDWLLHAQALALARSGKLTEARRTSEKAVQLALSAGQRERAATYLAAAAVWEALYGNSSAARAKARSALQLSNGRDTEYAVAFASATSSDLALAQRLMADLEKRFPEDTSVLLHYLPTLRAGLALHRGSAPEAIDHLQTAAMSEFEISAIAFNFFFGQFHPVYLRGEAFLAAGRPSEATAEFAKIVSHRGLLFTDPLDAMARLQLAHAYASIGDAEKAKTAYTDLFSIWKDADRNLPLLNQARSEFARLR